MKFLHNYYYREKEKLFLKEGDGRIVFSPQGLSRDGYIVESKEEKERLQNRIAELDATLSTQSISLGTFIVVLNLLAIVLSLTGFTVLLLSLLLLFVTISIIFSKYGKAYTKTYSDLKQCKPRISENQKSNLLAKRWVDIKFAAAALCACAYFVYDYTTGGLFYQCTGGSSTAAFFLPLLGPFSVVLIFQICCGIMELKKINSIQTQ